MGPFKDVWYKLSVKVPINIYQICPDWSIKALIMFGDWEAEERGEMEVLLIRWCDDQDSMTTVRMLTK